MLSQILGLEAASHPHHPVQHLPNNITNLQDFRGLLRKELPPNWASWFGFCSVISTSTAVKSAQSVLGTCLICCSHSHRATAQPKMGVRGWSQGRRAWGNTLALKFGEKS